MKVRADFKDVTGQRFGKLLALAPARLPDGTAGFKVRCDCGTEKLVAGNNLRRSTRSCGCGAVAAQLMSHKTHGKSKTPEYQVFCTMKQRCNNPNSDKYPEYGGAGIECRFASFEHFLAEIGQRPSSRHSVDRVNNFSHYQPGNVRWATPSEQQKNRRKGRGSIAFLDFPALAAAPLSFGA